MMAQELVYLYLSIYFGLIKAARVCLFPIAFCRTQAFRLQTIKDALYGTVLQTPSTCSLVKMDGGKIASLRRKSRLPRMQETLVQMEPAHAGPVVQASTSLLAAVDIDWICKCPSPVWVFFLHGRGLGSF